MSEQDEVNEQARLNGMGAERELALMAKLEAATLARQQAQEALYAERDRHAATVKKMQADLEMRTDESVRYRGVLDATVIVIEEMRQEIESLQAVGMTEIDIADDDALRFVQRVLETNAPEAYRLDARAKVSAIRTRALKARATSQPDPVWSPAYTRGPARKSAPVAAAPALVPLTQDEMTLLFADRIGFGDEPLQTCNREDLVAIVNGVQAHHGIGLTVGDTE